MNVENLHEEIKWLKARATVIAEVTREFGEAVANYDQLLEVISQQMARVLKNTCVLQIVSEDRKTLTPVAISATDPHVIDQVRTLLNEDPIQIKEHSIYKAVISSGNSLLVSKIDQNENLIKTTSEHARLASKLQMHSGLIVAIRLQDQVIGTLSMGRYEKDLTGYNERDQELAETLAVHVALMISNARLLKVAQKELAERLSAESNLRRAEEQLRQLQKMEAVGKLAGGIAHDFNNLLSIIGIYCDNLVATYENDPILLQQVQSIASAQQRGAALTKQLLLFSRRQPVNVSSINLNYVISDLVKLLVRLVGENISIKMDLSVEDGTILANVNQMEQVITNLIVNSKDAMPNGGLIKISTENIYLDELFVEKHIDVKIGPHVLLTVSDTGFGMVEETKSRIFEPFFTTKEQGKGTGLGLSTVYGIVKQSNGSIWVYSEPGLGTTFKIFFPKTDSKPLIEEIAPMNKSKLIGNETILLVEDEELLRSAISQQLKNSGYKVFTAAHGNEAFDILNDKSIVVDLIVTDLVMPKIGGKELVEKMIENNLKTKVLYISGYAEDALLKEGLKDCNINFLEKPFSTTQLLTKIRGLLKSQSEKITSL